MRLGKVRMGGPKFFGRSKLFFEAASRGLSFAQNAKNARIIGRFLWLKTPQKQKMKQ